MKWKMWALAAVGRGPETRSGAPQHRGPVRKDGPPRRGEATLRTVPDVGPQFSARRRYPPHLTGPQLAALRNLVTDVSGPRRHFSCFDEALNLRAPSGQIRLSRKGFAPSSRLLLPGVSSYPRGASPAANHRSHAPSKAYGNAAPALHRRFRRHLREGHRGGDRARQPLSQPLPVIIHSSCDPSSYAGCRRSP